MAQADEKTTRPEFTEHTCYRCDGTGRIPDLERRLFFFRSSCRCDVCEGSGTIEYVRRANGKLVRAESWRNSLEGQLAEKIRRETNEYPTWATLAVMGKSDFPDEPDHPPPYAYPDAIPIHPPSML